MLRWRYTLMLCLAGTLLAGVCFAPAVQAAAAAGSAPATTAARPAITTPLSGDALAAELDQRFGIWFVGEPVPPTLAVTIPGSATSDAAVALLQAGLKTIAGDFQLEEVPGSAHKVWQIKSAAGVVRRFAFGNDPDQIASSDDLITQIVPLKALNVGGFATDIQPLISSGAVAEAQAHNCLIVTDTSAKVRRMVEVIAKLDATPPGQRPVIEYRQLIHANAADAAREINRRFSPPPQTAPASNQASTQPVLAGRLYADSDARTNTVVLNGPAELIKQALEMLDQLDAAPATVPAGGGLGGGR